MVALLPPSWVGCDPFCLQYWLAVPALNGKRAPLPSLLDIGSLLGPTLNAWLRPHGLPPWSMVAGAGLVAPGLVAGGLMQGGSLVDYLLDGWPLSY